MARLGQGGGWSFIKCGSPCSRTRNPFSLTSLMMNGIVGGRNSSKKEESYERRAGAGDWGGRFGSVSGAGGMEIVVPTTNCLARWQQQSQKREGEQTNHEPVLGSGRLAWFDLGHR